MQKYLVAIGGGKIHQLKTLAIDKRIVELTRKKHPKLLFIPTASSDSEKYVWAIEAVYGKRLGCKVDSLLLIKNRPDKRTIQEKIMVADIIYVGGGNTLKMMKLWRKLGVDKLLRSAYNNGAVLCGISAGAICWFEYGHSDSMSFYHPDNWDYIRVKGMGVFRGCLCPHFNGQTLGIKRKNRFKTMLKKMGGFGIAIDNQAAIEFCNDTFRIINSKKGAKTYKLYEKKSKIMCHPIEPQKDYVYIQNLYSKTT